MSTNIFDKGNFEVPSKEYTTMGLVALSQLSEFQTAFNTFDTDTTINSIRDTIIAGLLDFDCVNTSKHGFDAKRTNSGEFLEIKQCGVNAKRWGGTWNDTNKEKAEAFCDPRLFTAIGVWKGASDLQFIVYGQSSKIGEYLKEKVQNRKAGSRSTQTISISNLIKWGLNVYIPPDKSEAQVKEQLIRHNKKLRKLVDNGRIFPIPPRRP